MKYPHPDVTNRAVHLDRRPALDPFARAVLVCQHFHRLGLRLRWRSLPAGMPERMRTAQSNLQAMTESLATPVPFEVLPK